MLPVLPAHASSNFGLVADFPTVQPVGKEPLSPPTIWISSVSSDSLTVTDLRFVPSCSNWDVNCIGGIADPGTFNISATGMGIAKTACADRSFDFKVVDPATGQVRITPADGKPVVLTAHDMASDLDTCRISFTMTANRVPNHDSFPSVEGFQTNQNMRISGTTNGQSLTFTSHDIT
ncbi:MAG TPA: hypothetical protein VM754_10960, partial [Actinomycetota bacterium]|nr:hypothetical protein [Actinomycetota bacterium]